MRSLKELDVEEKSILLMKYQDEFSIKEISETL
ncbi:sigma factor-like helix-turn-helix DNA-binding protein, partial [Empedobacter sp.]